MVMSSQKQLMNKNYKGQINWIRIRIEKVLKKDDKDLK